MRENKIHSTHRGGGWDGEKEGRHEYANRMPEAGKTLRDHGNYDFPLAIPTTVMIKNLTLCSYCHSSPRARVRDQDGK